MACSLLALALGGSLAQASPGAPPGEVAPPEPGVTVEVMSFNTWGLPFPFSPGARRSRLAEASAFFGEQHADIVGLQELLGRSRSLIDHGPYTALTGGALETGLALLSTLPLEHRQERLFAPERRWDPLTHKGYLHGQTTLSNGVQLQVFVTHLEAGLAFERRQRAARRLAEAVEVSEGPAVVMGDFNLGGAARDRAIEQEFSQLGWVDAGHGAGPTHRLLDQRLDRIYLKDGADWCLSSRDFTVLGPAQGADERWSDHRPVRATLMVEPCDASPGPKPP
jgi:endonuclease/exonuclease/phosphatase family metal-dependent hydrolase